MNEIFSFNLFLLELYLFFLRFAVGSRRNRTDEPVFSQKRSFEGVQGGRGIEEIFFYQIPCEIKQVSLVALHLGYEKRESSISF